EAVDLPKEGRRHSSRELSGVRCSVPSRTPRVAHRQGLPDVPVGLVPVDEATAVLTVDLPVDRPVRSAPVLDVPSLDPFQDSVELSLADPKAIVLQGNGTIHLIEVERQAVVHEHRTEGADARFRPRHAKERGEQFRGGSPVPRWDHRMVQFNAHQRPPSVSHPIVESHPNGHSGLDRSYVPARRPTIGATDEPSPPTPWPSGRSRPGVRTETGADASCIILSVLELSGPYH